jgi:uncharacterized DUF497 family protein
LLKFDWDDENLQHIARHRVTAAEAEHVLAHPTIDIAVQQENGEERFKEAGTTANGRILEVVTTWRGGRIRVITAYDASSYVEREYHRTR